jgi:hypothetical protein
MALQSNAQVLPDEDETGSIEGLNEEQQVEEQPTETPAPADESQPVVEDDLPEPLRNKSPKEIAAMYLDAQKMIGRHATELGELRRMTDSLVKKELERRNAPSKPADEDKKEATDPVDYFADPEKAISSAIERHPLVKKLLEENQRLGGTVAQTVQERATARFNQLHPDAGAILADEGFRKWVGGSKIRQQLLVQAHTKYDVDAGHELLSTWKALNPPKPAPAPAQATSGKGKAAAAAAAAAVPSGGNASPAGGGKTNNAGGKIYRRADIMRLMEDDPDRYESMADEIRLAYEQGRVR